MFQHTAARRRLVAAATPITTAPIVSTHSRPKAAGHWIKSKPNSLAVSTHSRPKAAGPCASVPCVAYRGFNTQPPEGGWFGARRKKIMVGQVSTHSRPKAAGLRDRGLTRHRQRFQHTAARRRLGPGKGLIMATQSVSTHSRPKAAGMRKLIKSIGINVSTHSRPKAAGLRT